MKIDEFKELLLDQGSHLYRDMPWRRDTRAYYILVSELMLQQTQVTRVIPKFAAFIEKFPSEKELATASLGDVLKLWQGLGYNRRAKFLHEAAKEIIRLGSFPEVEKELVKLPGIGKNTAGAILTYSFNHPSIFIETNIRTVYIHHFFNDNFEVNDSDIIDVLKQTIDNESPRDFYWSLMDYGSWLKTKGVRNNSQSKHYKKQTILEGSLREMRGMIIRNLTTNTEIETLKSDYRFEKAIEGLLRDGLIRVTPKNIKLTK